MQQHVSRFIRFKGTYIHKYIEQRMHELAWLVGNDLSAHLLDAHRVPELLGIPTVATKTKVCRIRRMLKYSDVCRRMLPYAD